LGVEPKKFCEIQSTTNKVISAHVDLPLVDIARSAYANAFEFGPRDFGAEEILPPPLISFQSDLGRRADSRWALPQFSSLLLFLSVVTLFDCTTSFPFSSFS